MPTILSSFRRTFRNLKSKIRQPAHIRLYHYERQGLGERSRVHLRVDPDGRGLLLVNASRVMHLNPTAAFMARLALEGTAAEQAVGRVVHRYQVSPQQALDDYTQFVEQLDELVRPDGACPIHDLELEVTLPFSAQLSAPYRMDLALTYRCNNDCAHCYNARPRDYPELPTSEWKRILDRLWALGIPHVVFTGGEPTLRPDLPELVAHAEANGQITGLNTNARRLSDADYVRQLVEAGLDHVQVTLESHDPAIHDRMVGAPSAWRQTVAGIENALDSPLFVMTNTTMLKHNSPVLSETLEFLSTLGVPTIGLNALIYAGRGKTVGTGLDESELEPLLELARSHTQAHQQRLIWYTPTQYCHFDPMQLELGVKGCTAALYNMCTEPDGVVIPCQSYYQGLGNLLTDPWQSIWEHELAISLRQRRYAPQKCRDCALLPECGGGCPLLLDD
ncbi:MAG: PqqD family peptide modification chaperone [Anaerolineales bacterium]|nr:PqqD family peptide modification chaperone [Anaerolineales bacterium]